MRHLVLFLSMLALTSTAVLSQDGMVLPHFAADQDSFSTKITIENRGKGEQTFRMRHLNDAGDFISTQEFKLAAGETQIHGIAEFDGVQASHAIFDPADGLFAGVTFTPTNNSQNPIFVQGITEKSKRWRVYPSNWNLSFDGLAIVNSSCFETPVRIRLFNAMGELQDEVQRGAPLPRFGKWLVSLEKLFNYETGNYIEVIGDAGLAVMALKGNRQFQRVDSFLVGNLAVPFSTYEDMKVELRENQEKWSLAGFGGNYQIQVRRLCFCLPEFQEPINISVSGFRFQALTYSTSGEPLEVGRIPDFHTVESLFDFIENAFNRNVSNVYITYDETYGYPSQVSIDYDACLADEEVTYFTKLMPSPTAP